MRMVVTLKRDQTGKRGCTIGDVCSAGVCGGAPDNVCETGDGCCPVGCTSDNDKECLYWKSGPQFNIEANSGEFNLWEPCWNGQYNQEVPLTQILDVQCTKAKLLLTCKSNGQYWIVTAMGLRTDVLHDCGNQVDCAHQANGVGWYFSDDWSWGFAPGGATVQRDPCDSLDPGLSERLCWVTSQGMLKQGGRCGGVLSGSQFGDFQRAIYQSD